MEDDIGVRLRDTADRCIKAYEGWEKGKKDFAARESLMEAVHDLRKVSSRVEIEVAVSERDEVTAKPLAIPPHRAQRPREMQNFLGDDSENMPSSAAPGGGGPSRGRRPMRSGGPRQNDDSNGNS